MSRITYNKHRKSGRSWACEHCNIPIKKGELIETLRIGKYYDADFHEGHLDLWLKDQQRKALLDKI